MRTVIIAQIRVSVPAGHFKHFVRTRHKSPVFNSFNAIRRNPAQHFARLFPRIAHVFTANLILSFIILVRCSPHFFVPPVFFILRMLLRKNFVKQRKPQNLNPKPCLPVPRAAYSLRTPKKIVAAIRQYYFTINISEFQVEMRRKICLFHDRRIAADDKHYSYRTQLCLKKRLTCLNLNAKIYVHSYFSCISLHMHR